MQQRQLRLGDILDDYCPRERRVTNHAVVAMVGQDVKQTRCTTCDSDHEYKHAKVPRQRRKPEAAPGVGAHPASAVPSRVVHHTPPQVPESPSDEYDDETSEELPTGDAHAPQTLGEAVGAKLADAERREQGIEASGDDSESALNPADHDEHDDDVEVDAVEEGPVHRPLIRATLPRPEGQQPPQRPAPDFTIRQPGGRGRFRSRQQRGPQFGNRGGNAGGGRTGNGNGNSRMMGAQGPLSRSQRRHGPGRKRQK
jgi:hypothetical protein